MTNIISKLHLSKPPLAFPNVIARLLDESGVDYNALDSDDKVPKGRPITAEVMKNIRHPQYHSPPPHQSPQLHQFHEQPFPPSPQYQFQHHFEEEQPAGEATFEAAYGTSADEPCSHSYLPRHIPFRIQSNVNEDRPMFDGMLRPWPVGGESSVAPPQQAPPEANAPRRENPDSDDE
ncbi:hypothetical protein PIB30_093607 [Stylosanthes scabra]|uniref:Uncharacterized protein n=1 Tax=Stylosanthes scabra TaxID=79078 RepID=A0ABU6SW34_9FABA|nr:hypothetical protein [Stylosanthes scabra]